MGLKFLGRRLRRSRVVWRFRLRNDAVKANSLLRRIRNIASLLSLGAVQKRLAFAFLPTEIPSVFAVLFEAAKAKSALGSSRACLSKNATAFLCVTREGRGYVRGVCSPYADFLGHFFVPRQRSVIKHTKVRTLCSHSPIFSKYLQFTPCFFFQNAVQYYKQFKTRRFFQCLLYPPSWRPLQTHP